MKKQSIKWHIWPPYSIVQKRKSTMNHAFASAMAPVDEYDEIKLIAGLRLLGQDPEGELSCVYCELQAETWDHLIGLVEKAELRGYGHQLGNLVPCCSRCNCSKGGKDWQVYLRTVVTDDASFEAKRSVLAAYLERYAYPVNLELAAALAPEKWARYRAIKLEMFRLMAEADTIAPDLRSVVADYRPCCPVAPSSDGSVHTIDERWEV